METFNAEPIKINTDQILENLTRTQLGTLIQSIKNCGDIEDRTLRRLWCNAKHAIEHVERHLKSVVEERNAQRHKQEQGH